MRQLFRLAVGGMDRQTSPRAMIAALLSALSREGQTPQLFLGKSLPGQSSCGELACGEPDLGRVIASRATRHIDSWTMSRCKASQLVSDGCLDASFALVHGNFGPHSLGPNVQPGAEPNSPLEYPLGSSLSELAKWLDLAKIAVVDASQPMRGHLPCSATHVDGVLLDQLAPADLTRWQVEVESLWGTKVIGYLPRTSAPRREFELAGRNCSLSKELCDQLGNALLENLDLSRLLDVARRQNRPWQFEEVDRFATSRPLRVAIAWDEDFTGYFPDTIDRLEAAGAKLSDFSPRRCERIPEDCDLVYIGGARPQAPWQRIASNHCLMQSLRAHAMRGGRVYAEAEGAGLLCRELVLDSGVSLPMAGLLPIRASQPKLIDGLPRPSQPTTVQATQSSWLLGEAHDFSTSTLRAYEAKAWHLDIDRATELLATSADGEPLIIGSGNVVASQVWLHFAAMPELLARLIAGKSLVSDWAPQLR
ncbi:CobB/CobQ domain protein glutamine amidotransferase [Pirellula staleyi DSM 6068]|uniref:CobB/CobQ domain protein glutamine amidotransferase n=1 Tax=Pirellula staleyi (strain ATCC 27377 / DSM 6068 / ICPB 4128) TaxID=530564 RepID=D2R9F7_PIRSD|nr:glutamine amidotransferase [Pirellula staleyi]ADB17707.1 CobB/CobQ domain protein glutamine amidotransferase [Pirellula staleyi DSM 6068]